MSEFRTFGEGQADLRERISRMEPDLHAVKEDVAVLKTAVRTNGQETRSLKEAVQGNTEEIRSLKEAVQGNTEAIHSMQNDLKNINQRLEVVEAKVA
jgi:chromosome segregation ATPase